MFIALSLLLAQTSLAGTEPFLLCANVGGRQTIVVEFFQNHHNEILAKVRRPSRESVTDQVLVLPQPEGNGARYSQLGSSENGRVHGFVLADVGGSSRVRMSSWEGARGRVNLSLQCRRMKQP